MVLGPVLVVIEGVTLLLFRGGIARALLAGAMLMDVVPSASTRSILRVLPTIKCLPALPGPIRSPKILGKQRTNFVPSNYFPAPGPLATEGGGVDGK